MNNLKRRRFLGYEKDRFPLTQQVSDQVGYGLALAGARRTDDHEVLTPVGRGDCGHLRRVCGQ